MKSLKICALFFAIATGNVCAETTPVEEPKEIVVTNDTQSTNSNEITELVVVKEIDIAC